jgi:multiple sugar transport system permease protein
MKKSSHRLLIYLVLIISLIVTLFPIYWMIINSLKDNQEILTGKSLFFPSNIRWINYRDLWRNINFGLYLRNSFIICGLTTLLAMVLATLAGYSLSRFRFFGKRAINDSILATQMIPGIMFLIPIYLMFVKFHEITRIQLIGTFPGLIFVYSTFFVPFSVWILQGFFASIPVDIEEAALIDGCSRFRIFWNIAVPLARPGIIATAIYIFLTA